MKKLFSFFVILLGFGVGYFILLNTQRTVRPSAQSSKNGAPSEKTIGQPIKIEIPSQQIAADIESVGMDSEGRMDTPNKDMNVAWYNLGFKPGAQGSAVIAAHFDKKDGSPAVFYTISKLKEGDEVRVTDDQGGSYTFIVTGTESFPYDGLPLEKIFNTPGRPTLNLITCEGNWDKDSHNYSNRTVVYTELKDI